MLVLPWHQISLAVLVTIFLAADLRHRRLFSACLMASIASYVFYYIAIDRIDLYRQIPAVAPFDARFVETSTIIIGLFLLCVQAGRLCVRLALPARKPESTLTAVGGVGPSGVLIAAFTGALLIAVSADGWWLFYQYPLNKEQFAVISLGGSSAMANLLLLFAVHRARVLGVHVRLTMTIIMLVSVHYFLAGDRGSIIFLFVGFYALRLQSIKRLTPLVLAEIAAVVVSLLLLLQVTSSLRSETYGLIKEPDTTFLEEIDLLPQTAAHMVFAIDLHDRGVDTFDGDTLDFLNTIIIQLAPSGVLTYLGVELYNGPWRLAAFEQHGGGFFVPAELYFVGGYTTVVVMSFYFGVLAGLNDRMNAIATIRKDTLIVMVVLIAAAANFYSLFYGVQAFHRMLTLPLIILALRGIWHRLGRSNVVRVTSET